MYSHELSADRRQGDILHGTAVVGPSMRVVPVAEVAAAISQQQDYELTSKLKLKIQTEFYVVLSQCCDVERDDPIIVAPLVSGKSIPWTRLSDEDRVALRSNGYGSRSEDVGDGVVIGRSPDGTFMDRRKLVLPGSFYFAPLNGHFDDERVCNFRMLRAVRREDFLALGKVGELTRDARDRLRQRLAVFFGRVPDEDLSVLEEERRERTGEDHAEVDLLEEKPRTEL